MIQRPGHEVSLASGQEADQKESSANTRSSRPIIIYLETYRSCAPEIEIRVGDRMMYYG